MTKAEMGFGAALITGALMAASLALPAHAAGMNEAECQKLWSKIDSSSSGSVAMNKVQPYLANKQSVDANSDGMISKNEFSQGCTKGLIQSSASSGAAGGASGSGSTTSGSSSSMGAGGSSGSGTTSGSGSSTSGSGGTSSGSGSSR